MILKLESETTSMDVQNLLTADVSKSLSIRILKDRSPRLWSKIWVQNLSINNSSEQLITLGDDLIHMTNSIKGMLKAGDLIEFHRLTFNDMRMSINGIEVAQYSKPYFFEFLLTAWVGAVPPSSSLKAQLMGVVESQDDLLGEFDSWPVDDQAITRVSSWIEKPEPEVRQEEPEVRQEEPEFRQEEPAAEVAARPELAEQTQVASPESLAEVAVVNEEVIEQMPEEVEPVVEQPAAVEEPYVEESGEELEQEAPLSVESLLAIQQYQKDIVARVYQNVRYPRSALKRQIEGSLRVIISVSEDGSLNDMVISESSGYAFFDKALERAVKDAQPFDPIPSDMISAPLSLEAPFAFRIDRS